MALLPGVSVAGAGEQDDATALRARLPRTRRYLFVLGTARGGGGTFTLHVEVD